MVNVSSSRYLRWEYLTLSGHRGHRLMNPSIKSTILLHSPRSLVGVIKSSFRNMKSSCPSSNGWCRVIQLYTLRWLLSGAGPNPLSFVSLSSKSPVDISYAYYKLHPCWIIIISPYVLNFSCICLRMLRCSGSHVSESSELRSR